MKKIKKCTNKVARSYRKKMIIALMLGFAITLIPTIALANPDPIGNAQGWLEGQLQSAARIGIMFGIAFLVFTKKLTSSIPWLITIIVAAFVLWNIDATINFLGNIGRIVIR